MYVMLFFWYVVTLYMDTTVVHESIKSINPRPSHQS